MALVDAAGPRVTRGRGRWRRAAAGSVLGCGIAAFAMASTWSQLARTWREDAAFQWCWLVVPAVLYGLSRHLRTASQPQFDIRGLWATLPAAALWWICDLMNIAVGQEFALVVALQGIAWSALGPRLYRESFATLALLFLMVPSADFLQPALRAITVSGLDLFASATGLPHRVEGYEVTIGTQHYIVIDECSGLASVTLSMFLGFFFGTLLYRSLWKVLSLAAFAALLGVACNLARVDVIVWIDWLRASQMPLTAHADIQWLSVLAVLGLLLFSLGRLRGDPAAPASAVATPSPVRRRDRFAPVLAGLSVPLAVWALNAAGRTLATASMGEERAPPQSLQSSQLLPATLAGAARTADGTRWIVDPGQSTASSVTTYRRGDAEIQAFVVTTLSAADKLPRWQLPATRSGHWRDMQTKRETDCDARGCVAYSQLILQGSELSQRRSMEAAYCGAGVMTDSTLRIRAAHAWNRLKGLADSQRSVVLVMEGDGLSASEAIAALRSLCAMNEKAIPSSSGASSVGQPG